MRHTAPVVPLLLGLVSCGLAACGSPTEGAVAGTAADVAADAACHLVGLDFEVGIIDGISGDPASPYEPLASRRDVVFHARGTTSTNSPDDSEVVSLDAESHARTQLTANDTDDLVVDARGGAVLVDRAQPDGQRQLVYLDATREVVLQGDMAAGGAWGWSDEFSGAVRKRVEPGGAAWWDAAGDGAVRVWDGAEVRVVSEPDGLQGAPDLHGGVAAWTTRPSATAPADLVVASAAGVERVATPDADERFPSVGAERVFWLLDGAVLTRPIAGGAAEVLDEGPCNPPFADGPWAVFACAVDGDGATPGATWDTARRLHVFDGETVREVARGQEAILAPRVAGGLVAWLAYAEPLGDGQAVGTIRVAAADGSFGAVDIAPIGSGCYACQVPWPPPKLSLSPNALAWNYAVAGAQPGAVGYAALRPLLDCGSTR